MDIDNFEEYFILHIQRLLNAEQQLIRALPNMAAAAHSEELRTAFQGHTGQTETHAKRLEQILTSMDEGADVEECEVTQALIDEADDLIAAMEESPLRDTALITSGSKVEHFEMAAYTTASLMALELGHADAAALLKQTLAEEAAANAQLISVGKATVFTRALALDNA